MMSVERSNALYELTRAIVLGIAKPYFRLRVLHAERIPESGPVILASNHVSFADPPLIGCGVRRPVHFLARSTLFTVPLFGRIIPLLNAVPVDREGASGPGLKAVLEHLRQEHVILLFPEGTRSPDGSVRPAKPGIGLITLRSDAALVPVRVFGGFEAFGRHRLWPRPHPIVVKFGHPLDLDAERHEARTCSKARLKEIYQEVATRIMRDIAAMEPVQDRTQFP